MQGRVSSHRWSSHAPALALALGLLIAGCTRAADEAADSEAAPAAFPALSMYAPMDVPADNPMTAEKVELGRLLYYDTRLSGDGQRSCYGCHLEEHGLTDGRALALGAFDQTLTRSTPTMWNIGYHSTWYWDGRAATLEGQAQAAWRGGNMGASGNDGAPSMTDVCASLGAIDDYATRFETVFGEACTPDNVPKALAAFMRTIVSTDSPWIRFREGDTTALTEAAQRGYAVFDGKARCSQCHAGILLTDQQFHNIGIGMDAAEPDLGRFRVTAVDRDRGAFKTPTLIDVSKSAPYFHDGSVATLEDAMDLMIRGGLANEWLDSANLQPAELTPEERADLLQFLRELTATYTVERPTLPQAGG